MRVMLVGVAIEGGGAEQVMQDLGRGLIRKGHETTIVYLEGTEDIVPSLEEEGIQCIRLLSRKKLAEHWWSDITPRVIFQLRSLIRDINPDIIHMHVPRPSMWLSLAKRLSQEHCALVYTEHNIQSVHSIRGIFAHYIFLPVTQHVVCVSEAVRDSFLKRWNWSSSAVSTIYNGIAPARVEPGPSAGTLKADLDIPSTCSVLCNVANVAHRKGHDILIRALKHLSQMTSTEFICLCAGSLDHEPKTARTVQEMIDENGLQAQVRMLGSRSDVPNLLTISDVFVLASRQEGLPITILEAMTAAKPVVTTDVGGCAEAVINDKTGLVVPPEDPKALADALRELIENPKRSKQLGQAGSARANDHFTVESMGDQHEQIYQEVLGR